MLPSTTPLVIAAPAIALQAQGATKTEIANTVRDAVQGALEGTQAAVAPAAPRAPQATIDALNLQIAAERASIEKLTQALVPGLSDARESALTSQLEASQERLTSLQAQLDQALGVSTGRAVAGALPPLPPLPSGDEIPPEAVEMTQMFFITVAVIAIGIPLARAFGRWLDRRGGGAPSSAGVPSDIAQRFDRLEQGVEAIAIEVERVSEGQRFTNKLMGEMRALPSPNALEQWPQGAAKEAVPVERRAGS